MRINRQALLNIANDTVAQRTRQERGIVAVYLTGSLLGDDFLLGGTADIDLVFIHLDEAPQEREIVHQTDEVHLDIAHYPQKVFANPRRLRMDPWLGHAIFGCRLLHDSQHFMDFTQASVRGQFDRPEIVLGRARPLLAHARQLWTGLATGSNQPPGPPEVSQYLQAVHHAANCVAVLSGPPLTERRFLLQFPQRAEAAGHAGLHPGLLGMLGAPRANVENMTHWVEGWGAAYGALAAAERPPKLAESRRKYYQSAFQSMLGGQSPPAVLWPLLRTWTQAASLLPVKHPGRKAWGEACQQLGLLGAGFPERVNALDAYLDTVDETLDAWAQENGV